MKKLTGVIKEVPTDKVRKYLNAQLKDAKARGDRPLVAYYRKSLRK